LEDFEVVAFCYTPLPTLAIQSLIQKDEIDNKDSNNNNSNNNTNNGQQPPIPTLFFVDPLTIVEGGIETVKRSSKMVASCTSPPAVVSSAAEVGSSSSSSSAVSVSGGVAAVVTSRMMRANTSVNLSEQSTPLLQSPLNACEEVEVDDGEQEEREGEEEEGVSHNHVVVDDDIDHGVVGSGTTLIDDANIVSLADVISHDEMQSRVVSPSNDNDAANAFNSFLLREGERGESDTETFVVMDGSHDDFTSSLSLSTSKDNAQSADIITPHELLPEVVVAVKALLNTTYRKVVSKDDSCINTRPITTTRVDSSLDDDGHGHTNSRHDDDSIVTNETAAVAVRRKSMLTKTQSADNLSLNSYHHHHCDRLDSIGEDLNNRVEQSLIDADDFIFHHQSADNLLDVITIDQSSDHHPAATVIIDPTIVSRHESSEAMIGGSDHVSAFPAPIDIFSMNTTSTDHDNTSNRIHQQQQQQYQYQHQYQQQLMSRRQVRKFYGAQVTSQQVTSQQSRQLKRTSTRQLWSLMRQQVLYCTATDRIMQLLYSVL
jgi:hypothetical protein